MLYAPKWEQQEKRVRDRILQTLRISCAGEESENFLNYYYSKSMKINATDQLLLQFNNCICKLLIKIKDNIILIFIA
jgi:hypothetical protein